MAVKESSVTISRADAVGDVVTNIVSMFLVAGLWFAGASFTNTAVVSICGWFSYAYPIEGLRWYLIPVCFSVVEILGYERRKSLPSMVLWFCFGVAALDFATSVYGVAVTVAGKTVPLMNGYKIDASPSSAAPIIAGILLSAVLTFIPERVTTAAVASTIKSLGVIRRLS